MSEKFSLVVSDNYRAAERLSFRRLENVDVLTVTPATMRRLVHAGRVELILVETWKQERRGYTRYYRVTVSAEEHGPLIEAIDETHRNNSRPDLIHGPVSASADRTLEDLENKG